MTSTFYKQFAAEGGCNAFLLGDLKSSKACLIDPRADELERYEAVLSRAGLKVEWVLDTHTHADHYSGSHLAARHLGARIAMSDATRSARASLRLKDGQTLELGGLGLEIFHTPGHTPDSMSVIARGDFGVAAFTGDTLFIGGSGRTDFPGADPAAQYESIHSRLDALDAKAFVLPAHDYSGILFSTIGEEKRTNPHWLIRDKSEFIRVKKSELLEASAILKEVVEFNLSANPGPVPMATSHAMCASCVAAPGPAPSVQGVRDYRGVLEGGAGKGAAFIDVREPEEYEMGRIPGTVNIPMGEMLGHMGELAGAKHLYLSCQRGGRSMMVAQTLTRLGYENVTNVEGGFSAWLAAGYRVER